MKEIVKIRLYALCGLIVGALTVPLCDGDATGFLFCLIFFGAALFAKEEWLNDKS